MSEWLNMVAACEHLHVSRWTVYRLCDEGRLRWHEIPGVKGRHFSRSDLDQLMEPQAPKTDRAPRKGLTKAKKTQAPKPGLHGLKEQPDGGWVV